MLFDASWTGCDANFKCLPLASYGKAIPDLPVDQARDSHIPRFTRFKSELAKSFNNRWTPVFLAHESSLSFRDCDLYHLRRIVAEDVYNLHQHLVSTWLVAREDPIWIKGKLGGLGLAPEAPLARPQLSSELLSPLGLLRYPLILFDRIYSSPYIAQNAQRAKLKIDGKSAGGDLPPRGLLIVGSARNPFSRGTSRFDGYPNTLSVYQSGERLQRVDFRWLGLGRRRSRLVILRVPWHEEQWTPARPDRPGQSNLSPGRSFEKTPQPSLLLQSHYLPQGDQGRRAQWKDPPVVAQQGLFRLCPFPIHGLNGVGTAYLSLGVKGNEEPRVEPHLLDDRGHPMGKGSKGGDGKPQALIQDHVPEPAG